MTPEEARKLLDGITPAPWKAEILSYEQPPYLGEFVEFWVTAHNNKELVNVYDIPEWHANEIGRNFTLMAAAPDMAAMIANMTTEYSVQLADGELVGAGWGTHETAWCDCDAWQRDGYDARIVCRYVTAPQPLGAHQ